MQIEHEIKIIPIDNNYQAAVQDLIAQGWNLIPGMTPIGIHPVVRVKQDAVEGQPVGDVFGAQGTMTIDETKIGIHRAGTPEGQVEWPDGTTTLPDGTVINGGGTKQ